MSAKAKILVVDDEPVNVKLLAANLEPQGYDVLTAANGRDALAVLAAGPVDLILLDVMMPGLNGFEVTARLRSDKATQLIPIVLVTALKDTSDRVKGIEAGCDDFISKPFDRVEVLARVKALLKISYYRRLLDEKEKFEAVVRRTQEGIVICDNAWSIVEINPAAGKYLDITGASRLNIVEHIFNNFSVSSSREEFVDLASGHKRLDIARQATQQFKLLCLELDMDAVKDPSGAVSSIVLSFRDVTQIRKEELNKQDFLALISHKLRTPMTVISGHVSLLNDEILGTCNEKQKKSLAAISNQSDLLIGLIGKLIKFAEINRQALDLSLEDVEPALFFTAAADALIAASKARKIEFRLDCPDKDLRVRTSRGYLSIMINNLLENAVKFNDSPTVKISVSVAKTSEGVVISVGDNGRGIPAEDQEKIFERFYQVEKNFTGQVEGIGLGLALTKHLAGGLGGRIELASAIGKGSIFTIVLPG